jgi:hypothetical protein
MRRRHGFVSTVDALLRSWRKRPRGLAATKRALHASAGATLKRFDLERDLQRELGYSPDYREGVAASSRNGPRVHRRVTYDGQRITAEAESASSAPAQWARIAQIGAGGHRVTSSIRGWAPPTRRNKDRRIAGSARGKGSWRARRRRRAARLTAVHALGDLVSAKLVIEAIVEDLDVKRKCCANWKWSWSQAIRLQHVVISITALAAG